MFKNRKLEVRLVKDNDNTNTTAATEEEPKLDALDYALIAEEAATRLGKKLLIAAVVTVVTVAVVSVLANAADTALQNSINHE